MRDRTPYQGRASRPEHVSQTILRWLLDLAPKPLRVMADGHFVPPRFSKGETR